MTKAEQFAGASKGFETLRRVARRPKERTEQCELCNVGLHSDHPHLIEVTKRKLLCACDACALLFSGQAGTKFKRVPRNVRLMADFQMTDAEWDGLLIPINLAFFCENSLESRVSALYPSPAGATESLLPLEAWANIVQANPALNHLQSDVEALLVNRVGHARGVTPAEYYVVPIDACYRLVGLIRIHWRGLSGGTEVWQEIGKFFAGLRSQAEVVTERMHA
ncbi:MAG TPA: DUF5947 family protein [Candidatus Angelobacter sp.]|jgi:hypothetical protein|nr:DUF5947 family protein [Candidatus Angelobacter sp.]